MQQIPALQQIYGKRPALKRDFSKFNIDSILSTDIVIPVEAGLSYKKLIPLYEKITGSKIMLSCTQFLDLSIPDECMIEKRGGVTADKYLIVLEADPNKRNYIQELTPNKIPALTALTLREYLLFDLTCFIHHHKHLDEVYYYSSTQKARPYNVCFGSIFKYGNYETFPKVFHHHTMTVIATHCMATWKEAIFRNFKKIITAP